MDKQQIGRACSRAAGSREGGYRGDDSKLADKTRELNAREEDLDGRDEALKRSGLLEGP